MPMVRIAYVAETLGEDAQARKAAIASKVSQALSDEMGVAQGDVSVVFENVGARDWFVGRESVKEMQSKSL
ncbi:MAG: tautomerase family protein [Bauldia sp.]|uniref:tautomerase family protein n=1 Tax=Bauldia sp. TaxID=2575872 RepID=UPI001D557F7B|nr:tautomerase family protein [Bauldia sp.]MCB1497455.1 tautomerase family protein [Bauldia sp.]